MQTKKYSNEYKKRYVSLMVLTCLASVNMNAQAFANLDSTPNSSSNNQTVASASTPSSINYNVPTPGVNISTYGTGSNSKYYKWETDASGRTTLVGAQESEAQVKVNYDSSNPQSRLENSKDISSSPLIGNYIEQSPSYYDGGAIWNNGTIGDITSDFIGNYANYGGAIYTNTNNAKVGNIEGDFIGNHASSSSSSAIGGAIYNNYNSAIDNITGDFVGNYAEGKINAYGGAIYNNYNATIGDITGDFVGNYASGSWGNGGAIYNTGTIGDITGDFVRNYASGRYANGGAIYNTAGTIGDITGDFIGNYAEGETEACGGAIYTHTSNAKVGNIEGDFIGNHASSSGSSAYGGAIYNDYNCAIDNITGDFIGNYAEGKTEAYGGAIYNSKNSDSFDTTIGNIEGDFTGNYAKSEDTTQGGAIFNQGGKIGNINGNFSDNYAEGNSWVEGGAIWNRNATIGDITGDFTNNSVKAINSGKVQGGVIYNNDSTVGTMSGNFVNNSAETLSGDAIGGAIFNNNSTITSIKKSLFKQNKANGTGWVEGGAIWNSNSATIGDVEASFVENTVNTGTGTAQGGAIYNNWYSSIGNITGDFSKNSASGATAKGGAIMNNEYATITSISSNLVENSTIATNDSMGGAIYNIGTIGEIKGSLVGNYAKSETGTAKGGAIYSTTDIKLVADNANIEIRDNYTESAGVKDDNAVYLDNKDATLTFDIKNNGTLLLKDNIDGASGYKFNVIGDNTGVLYLQNDIRNANVTMGGITLNTINNDIHNYNFNSLTLANDINMAVDVDLANATMDRLSATSYGEHTGNLNITGMNLLSDAKQNVTSILFAENGLKDNVTYAGNELPHEGYQTSLYTPIYKYNAVYDNKDDGGYFVFTKGDKIYVPNGGNGGSIVSTGNSSDAFNPAVLGGSTSTTVGAIGTINQTINNSFHSVDTFMNLPSFDRISIKNQNKYAFNMTDDTMNLGRFSPLYQPQDEQIGVWIKPYATFESVPLKNGPKVNNIAYGTLVGFDTELKELGNGWDRVWTGYMGYNGASQHFSGVDSTQNGGLLGGTLTLYRGNFFNATTLNIGANVAENQTMYGTDNLTMLMSGVANKCGYNLEFKDGKLILQPNLILGYSFVNTFDYTNAAGLKIDNKPLHYIQVSPGVKLIGNLKNGWQPYASVNMVWNLMGETNSTANGIKLPGMSIKPYVQYGLGLQKHVKDNFTAYGQAMLHNGGRNGVALSAGFKWAIGKDKK